MEESGVDMSEARLNEFCTRLALATRLRRGKILFKLTEPDGEFCLDCEPGNVRVSKEIPAAGHDIQVYGPASRILAILEGKKDGRAQFLAGGIRVRGNMAYLSDLALQLGIIKEPF